MVIMRRQRGNRPYRCLNYVRVAWLLCFSAAVLKPERAMYSEERPRSPISQNSRHHHSLHSGGTTFKFQPHRTERRSCLSSARVCCTPAASCRDAPRVPSLRKLRAAFPPLSCEQTLRAASELLRVDTIFGSSRTAPTAPSPLRRRWCDGCGTGCVTDVVTAVCGTSRTSRKQTLLRRSTKAGPP